MFRRILDLAKATWGVFSAERAGSRGAAIAFYTVTSIAPILLIVIAVIAMLAAILFPVFAQAREKGRQTMCLSNLKQNMTALAMYIQDYDGAYVLKDYPTPGAFPSWPTLLIPYTKNGEIYSVASDTADNMIVFSHDAQGDVAPTRRLKTEVRPTEVR